MNDAVPRISGDGALGAGIPVVEVLSAEKIFANGFRGLAPIDLSIQRGEFVSLIGDRKSTRLNSSHSVTSRMPSSA